MAFEPTIPPRTPEGERLAAARVELQAVILRTDAVRSQAALPFDVGLSLAQAQATEARWEAIRERTRAARKE